MMSLTHEKRYRVQIADGETVEVVLVGCGGTGSFLALHLGRLAFHLREQYGRRMDLTFIDYDRVEEKNVGRQNFCPMEVGEPKAWALMRRLNAAFGLESKSVVAPFETNMVAGTGMRMQFRLLIGAVDNAGGRRELERCTKANGGAWWLDCGNHEHSGQVLLGNRGNIFAPEIKLGMCFALPLPSIQHPELLESEERDERLVESCAELAVRDAQSLMVNQMIAGWAASYVYRLLVGRDLDIYATYVDLVSGSARSEGICQGVEA